MSDQSEPSNWQQAIDGEWHGCPSLFEHDGTHVGTNKVSRASEFKDGRTTYWMDTRFDATGPLMDRFEIGSRMEFGLTHGKPRGTRTGSTGLLIPVIRSRYIGRCFQRSVCCHPRP